MEIEFGVLAIRRASRGTQDAVDTIRQRIRNSRLARTRDPRPSKTVKGMGELTLRYRQEADCHPLVWSVSLDAQETQAYCLKRSMSSLASESIIWSIVRDAGSRIMRKYERRL